MGSGSDSDSEELTGGNQRTDLNATDSGSDASSVWESDDDGEAVEVCDIDIMDYTAGVTRHNDPANRESILKPKFAGKGPAGNAPDDCESTLDFSDIYTDNMIERFVHDTNASARTTSYISNGLLGRMLLCLKYEFSLQ